MRCGPAILRNGFSVWDPVDKEMAHKQLNVKYATIRTKPLNNS